MCHLNALVFSGKPHPTTSAFPPRIPFLHILFKSLRSFQTRGYLEGEQRKCCILKIYSLLSPEVNRKDLRGEDLPEDRHKRGQRYKSLPEERHKRGTTGKMDLFLGGGILEVPQIPWHLPMSARPSDLASWKHLDFNPAAKLTPFQLKQRNLILEAKELKRHKPQLGSKHVEHGNIKPLQGWG